MSCYTPLTVKGFIDELNKWMNTRVKSLPKYGQPFYSQGGWEGWIQVELAMWLTAKGYDVMREERIYDNKYYRADLVINPNIPNATTIAIEIKCQSIYSNINTFLKSATNDINKLESLDDSWNAIILCFIASESAKKRKLGNYRIFTIDTNNLSCMYTIIKERL